MEKISQTARPDLLTPLLSVKSYYYNTSFKTKNKNTIEGIVEVSPYVEQLKDSPYLYWIFVKTVLVYNDVHFDIKFGAGNGYVGKEPLSEKLALAKMDIDEEDFRNKFITLTPVFWADYRIKNKELFITRVARHFINGGQHFLVNTLRQLIDAGLEVNILTIDYVNHTQTRSLLNPSFVEENGGDISFLNKKVDGKIIFLQSPMTKCFDFLGFREIDIINMKPCSISLSGKKSDSLSLKWISNAENHHSYNICNRRNLY